MTRPPSQWPDNNNDYSSRRGLASMTRSNRGSAEQNMPEIKGPEGGPLKEYNVRVATGKLRDDLYQRGWCDSYYTMPVSQPC